MNKSKEHQALNLIVMVARQARVSYEEHAAVDQAASLIQKKLDEKTDHEGKSDSSSGSGI